MLREEVLQEWKDLKIDLLRKWEKRKYLPALRRWIVAELLYPKRSSQVSNEQIAKSIRNLTGHLGLEYVDEMESEEED